MILLFFLIWLVFNGQITVEIVAFGLVIAPAMFLFVCRFMDYSLHRELRLYRKLPGFIRYVAILIWEIVQANLSVCRMILTRKETMEPVLVHIHTDLNRESSRVILANSITLTPGTITVSLTDRTLLVHCLDKSLVQGLVDSPFEGILKELEAV